MNETAQVFRGASIAVLKFQDAWWKLRVEIKREELRNHFALRGARSQERNPDS